MKTKKIPQRLCLGCRQPHPKKELIRIVRSPEGTFSVDLTGKKSGRGAYICHKLECFEAGRKSHGLEHSFSVPLIRLFMTNWSRNSKSPCLRGKS